MGKLTNTQRAAIYHAWKDGTQPKELAKQYSVSTSAISQMISRMNRTGNPAAEDKPEPKTMINKDFDDAVNAMIAESKSADVKPEKIPNYIWDALDDNVSSLNLEIEEREQRIAELKEELLNLKNQRDAIEKWMEDHT